MSSRPKWMEGEFRKGEEHLFAGSVGVYYLHQDGKLAIICLPWQELTGSAQPSEAHFEKAKNGDYDQLVMDRRLERMLKEET